VKQNIKNGYGLVWIYKKTKGIRIHLAVYLILTLLGTAITLSIAYFLKLFVDIATGDADESLFLVGFLAVSVIAVGGTITMINSVLFKYIYGKTECNLRTELMSVFFSRRMIDISQQHTGELLTKLTVDVQAISSCFPNIIGNIIGGFFSALFATIAIFFLSWKIAVIMLILTPLLMLIMGILTPLIKKASIVDKKNDEYNRSMMQEYLSRIILIKTYFMHDKIIERIKKTYTKKMKSGMKLGMCEGLATFTGLLIPYAVFMVSLGIGAHFVMKGETTIGSLIAIVQLLNFIMSPLANFAGTVSLVSQAVASSKRLGEIYESPMDNTVTFTESVDVTELIAENVNFSYNYEPDYSGNVNSTLENINLSFVKGEITGIIGKSGSGKSTLLKLLIGLYTPQKGKIFLKHTAGILDEVMPQVAYVPPCDYLFSGTVAENIIMSENQPRNDDMITVALAANVLDFIDSLEEGFETMIGESGNTVSSGQSQRIAIARAIYRKSPVIIFDEPTANLDVYSIEKFQSAVKQLAKNKICIIVTHDASTITICDKIYILENGHCEKKNSLFTVN